MKAKCSYEGCPRPSKARGWCNTHHMRWLRHGDPSVVVSPTPNPSFGVDHHAWKKSPSVMSIHGRVKRTNGPATLYQCTWCESQAQEWAYDHSDVNEYLAEKNGRMVPVSRDVSHYMPLCKSCHRRFDYAWANRKKELV